MRSVVKNGGSMVRFCEDEYVVKICELEGKSIEYRGFYNVQYCEHPLDDIQKMNLFVPEAYYRGESINGYDLHSAPIFVPNTVGGYMPGPADEPGMDNHTHKINSIFLALEHGYVVASIGVRGRTTGKVATEFFEGSKEGSLGEATGKMVGRAPALLVDYKAGIRFLRGNKDVIPGNVERMVTNGTSAGGALSALAGATGNSSLYDSYLEEIGAVKERDDIFAASCYCPIHNLENADTAYEWLFAECPDYHRTKHKRLEDGSTVRVADDGMMTEEQIALAAELKKLFPSYVNALELKDQDGTALQLDADGKGSFFEAVKEEVCKSADREYQTLDNETKRKDLLVEGARVGEQTYLQVENKKVVDLDWDAYVKKITRMKATPAFDDLSLKSPENEEFGDTQVDGRHFTEFSYAHSKVEEKEMADATMITRMNPVPFILGKEKSDVAPHWRVRHGAFDRDTSLAIPFILATALENKGYDVDFAFPWGLPHSGDYDLEETFAWIDELCKEGK